jgi:hypothetical protein
MDPATPPVAAVRAFIEKASANATSPLPVPADYVSQIRVRLDEIEAATDKLEAQLRNLVGNGWHS